MVYTGVIVLEPKERHSYEGRDPQTDEEYYEMTFAETDRVIREAHGIPIHIEHMGEQTRVGHVVQAGYDASRRVCVRFELDKGRDAEVARNLIQAGYLRGLSLAHVRETAQPIEISLCFRGARPGTGIIACDTTPETTSAACKQPTSNVVQSVRSRGIVQASASMDATAQQALSPAPPAQSATAPVQTQQQQQQQPPAAATGAPTAVHPNSVMNLVTQAIATPPVAATDAEIEHEAMRAVLEAAGVPEDKKQRVLSGVMHNKATVVKITEHAAKLEAELKAVNSALEQERRTKGDLTATQIAMVAKMIRAMDGDSAISPELEQRIKETHKDPLATWTAMLPAVVNASATALRFKEDAQRRNDAAQTHAMYQQYVRSTGWEPSLSRPTQQQQPPPQPTQQIVEASRSGAASAPAPLAYNAEQSYERMREEVFKRKISTLDLMAEAPRRPASDPVDSFTVTRRMLSGVVPSVSFAMQQ